MQLLFGAYGPRTAAAFCKRGSRGRLLGRLVGGLVGLGVGERWVKHLLLLGVGDVGENAAGGESAESTGENHDCVPLWLAEIFDDRGVIGYCIHSTSSADAAWPNLL